MKKFNNKRYIYRLENTPFTKLDNEFLIAYKNCDHRRIEKISELIEIKEYLNRIAIQNKPDHNFNDWCEITNARNFIQRLT